MSTDKSVWVEQVDTALISLLQSTLYVMREGVSVGVKAGVRKPDEDFNTSSLPMASISGLYHTFSKDRYSSIKVPVEVDSVSHSVTMEEPAIPYDLFYQVDFWSSSQRDMNDMTREWLSAIPMFYNLPVKDMSGAVRKCFMQQQGNVEKQDELKGNNRVFHTVISYKICVELDSGKTISVPAFTGETTISKEVFTGG